MDQTPEPMESLREIRSIMERSTTFMSLTGLSGVVSGLIGILTVIIVSVKLKSVFLSGNAIYRMVTQPDLRLFIIITALAALILALASGLLLTCLKARKRKQEIWNSVSRRFAVHLFLPLVAGGLFTIALVLNGQLQFVCPAMLLFFGLALVNAARFVQMDMFWLGTLEVSLGVAASFWTPGGLILWGGGFGLATLLYGTFMYFKYER